MALLSTKGVYGLNAMYELSLNKTNKPMQTRDIALKAQIPAKYLEQLLTSLKSAELVVSLRGAKGGYALAKSPRDITVKEILIALEGNLNIADDTINGNILELFYKECTQKMEKLFDMPLCDLEKFRQDDYINYMI
ncbi:MAG: Rrf2 family transcriptional regulator [Sulfurospirillaceae bacterium]|nr:Rrf2 family transcriptional regulator [Sulfurospirillaceae bacterium]MDD3463335.1 Rrf2 family transcriptional regulator [Sulfurospirillaceae bacterium]